MAIYHKHHIVPRHMGGSDDHSNLVTLTIEEHAAAHKQLYEKFGKLEDKLAWKMLEGTIGKDEYLKERAKLGGYKSSTKGKKKTEEHRRKISEAKKGKKRPEITGHLHPMYGSIDQSNRMNKLNNRVLTCPNCGYIGKNVGNMKRWHFENCRL